LPAKVDAARRLPHVSFGPIATGDCFVNSERTRQRLHGAYRAKACEMEGGAVAQVAERFGNLPLVNVRCLSDLAGAESHLDFGIFLPIAARNASLVAHKLAPVI
jgi:adenosylhomocysteine nucleosidase